MTRVDELVESIHALAVVRHLDAEAGAVSVVVQPVEADGPPGRHVTLDGKKPRWKASVRLGGGKWGHAEGFGATPTDALECLHSLYFYGHKDADASRIDILAEAERLRRPNPADAQGQDARLLEALRASPSQLPELDSKGGLEALGEALLAEEKRKGQMR